MEVFQIKDQLNYSSAMIDPNSSAFSISLQYSLLLNSKTETESYGDSASESRIIITYLYFSNSAINPIIYCFLNPNFRADLIKLFFKRGSIYSSCTKHFNSLK